MPTLARRFTAFLVAVLAVASFPVAPTNASDQLEVIEGTLLVEHSDSFDASDLNDAMRRAGYHVHADGTVERHSALDQLMSSGDDPTATAQDISFDPAGATYTYFVETADGDRIELDMPDGDAVLEPGTHVRVAGQQIDDSTLAIPDASRVQTLDAETPTAADTTKHVAVVLLNFAFDTRKPWTVAEVESRLFGSGTSVRNYFAEASGGSLSLTGDVFGYYTIDVPRNSACDYTTWGQAARAVAEGAGVDFSGYTNIQFIFPLQSSCGFGGVGQLGGSITWINGNIWLRTLAHELGHNFGAHHANAYRCTAGGVRVSLSDDCDSWEYGDPFDVMGGSENLPHAWHRIKMGLLDPDAALTVSGPGTYTLAPAGSGAGTRLLRITRADDRARPFLYIDYRQSDAPFDSWSSSKPIVKGVSLRLGSVTSVQTQLIDTTPSTETFNDASLTAGRSFYDPGTDLTVTTVAVTPSAATVQITAGPPPSDGVGPQVASTWPRAGSGDALVNGGIDIHFNEPVAGVTTSSVQLVSGTGRAVAVNLSLLDNQQTVFIDPVHDLAHGTRYTVKLSGAIVSRLDGDAIAPFSLTFTAAPFADTGSKFATAIAWAAETGVTHGCGNGSTFCPDGLVTREQMASFLTRALDLPAADRDYFDDDNSSKHEAAINALAASGITAGCGGDRFCPRGVVTREQMASFLTRAFDLHGDGRDYFDDDERSKHERNINALAASGITSGCADGRFCPSGRVTRGQMVEFLYRAIERDGRSWQP